MVAEKVEQAVDSEKMDNMILKSDMYWRQCSGCYAAYGIYEDTKSDFDTPQFCPYCGKKQRT